MMAKPRSLTKPSRELELEWLYSQAYQAKEEGKLRLAFRLCLEGAKAGHAASQLQLGGCYSAGTGVKKNPARALYWEKRAYRHGLDLAALNIGVGYRNADKPKQALAWFKRALKMGNTAARFDIAMILLRMGHSAKAIPHLKAVVMGKPPFDCCESEWEEAQDILKQFGRGMTTPRAKRTELNGRLSDRASELWKEGKFRSAIRLYAAAAKGGHFFSQLWLGDYYRDGTGVKRNLAKALNWYRRAYRQPIDRRSSALRIAEVYRSENKLERALAWFERAGANLEIAKIHVQQGDRRLAIRYLKKVLATKPPAFVSKTDWKEAQRLLIQHTG
jgi:TPR repeat protein